MRRREFLAVGAGAVLEVALAKPAPADEGEFTLSPIAIGFNQPVGIDHHPPTNQVIMSVNYPEGEPHNLELVAPDGTRTVFSELHGLTDELKIAAVRDTIGGFTPGEVFTGNGQGGQIIRVSPDGATVLNPWVTLPDEPGLMRGGLYVDRTGVFGGHLLVCTTSGTVWEIDAEGNVIHPSGEPAPLASLGVFLEGLATVPDDPEAYGPLAGKILVGIGGGGPPGEETPNLASIDREGNVAFYNLRNPDGVQIGVEDIDMIVADQNFFGVDYGGQTLWGAGPDQFETMVGDILITEEVPAGNLWRFRWNGEQLEGTLLVSVTQWEHVTFSPAGLDSTTGSDQTAPRTKLQAMNPGRKPTVDIVVRDPTTGLASVSCGRCHNARLRIGHVARGSASPVPLNAVLVDTRRHGGISFEVADVAGNSRQHTIKMMQLTIPAGGRSITRSFIDLPDRADRLRLQNDQPGVKRVVVRLSPENSVTVRLAPGKYREIDISAAVGAVVLEAFGPVDSRVLAAVTTF